MWGVFKRIDSFWIGRLITGFIKDSRDQAVDMFTDSEILIAADNVSLLKDSEPWDQHLDSKSLRNLRVAIRAKDELRARKIIDDGATVTAATWCLTALKTATVFACTKCPSIIREALPTTYL